MKSFGPSAVLRSPPFERWERGLVRGAGCLRGWVRLQTYHQPTSRRAPKRLMAAEQVLEQVLAGAEATTAWCR